MNEQDQQDWDNYLIELRFLRMSSELDMKVEDDIRYYVQKDGSIRSFNLRTTEWED